MFFSNVKLLTLRKLWFRNKCIYKWIWMIGCSTPRVCWCWVVWALSKSLCHFSLITFSSKYSLALDHKSRIGFMLMIQGSQPQQGRIRSTSATYSTVHGIAGSLTHWVRPEIEPASSWMFVGFLNCWATKGTLQGLFFSIGNFASWWFKFIWKFVSCI